MGKYIIGHCIGCGNRIAGAVFNEDRIVNMTNALEFLESGYSVRILNTDKDVGIDACSCE